MQTPNSSLLGLWNTPPLTLNPKPLLYVVYMFALLFPIQMCFVSLDFESIIDITKRIWSLVMWKRSPRFKLNFNIDFLFNNALNGVFTCTWLDSLIHLCGLCHKYIIQPINFYRNYGLISRIKSFRSPKLGLCNVFACNNRKESTKVCA
jgi:hypothetical protein